MKFQLTNEREEEEGKHRATWMNQNFNFSPIFHAP